MRMVPSYDLCKSGMSEAKNKHLSSITSYLLFARNPWGKRDQIKRVGEWEGAWGDGAREWTPYLLKKLNHRFGDDGVFWMSYDDMLETFIYLHRTRIFDQNWNVIQQWNSCDVSWFTGYLRSKFVVDVKTAGTVVLVLAQVCVSHLTRSGTFQVPSTDDC